MSKVPKFATELRETHPAVARLTTNGLLTTAAGAIVVLGRGILYLECCPHPANTGGSELQQ